MRIKQDSRLIVTTGGISEYGLGYEVLREAYGFNDKWGSVRDLNHFLLGKIDKIMLLGSDRVGNVQLKSRYESLHLNRLAKKSGISSVVVGYGKSCIGDKKAFVLVDGGTVTSSMGKGVMEQMLKHLELAVGVKGYTHLIYFGASQYLLKRGFENFNGLLAREIEPLTEEERRFMEQDFNLDDLVVSREDE
ncbi:MAG: hypothetical protein ABIJ18_02535 [archaeon]